MSLEMQYDTDNIFAKILRGELPAVKIFEDDNTLAFMDVFPQTDGHSLVIHKRTHATNLLDINTAALTDIMASVQRLAKATSAGLKPDGIRIAQFNGAPAGQTVFHLHFHVIPIYENKPTVSHGSAGPASVDVLEPIAEKIRAAL